MAFLYPVVKILGAKENTFLYTKQYVSVMLAGTVANIILDPLFIFVFGMKIQGAAMLILPFVGATSISRNTFNAMGKPYFAFGITIVRQLILYIPMLLVFNRIWGYAGLIHAQPVEESVCMVFSMILLFRNIK